MRWAINPKLLSSVPSRATWESRRRSGGKRKEAPPAIFWHQPRVHRCNQLHRKRRLLHSLGTPKNDRRLDIIARLTKFVGQSTLVVVPVSLIGEFDHHLG